MKYGLKRPIQTYLLHIFWIALGVYYTMKDISAFGQWILGATTFIGVISLLHIVIRRNYFEVVGRKLVIQRDFFRTKVIDLDNIERLELQANPFSLPRIILKDNRTVRYLESQTNVRELREFMKQFNIPVE